MKNIFDEKDTQEFIHRISRLTPETQPLWGKMNVAQMLAHCCVIYEMVYTDKHPKPNAIKKFLLKTFVKRGVTNEVPYKKNSPTSAQFIITNERDFAVEKQRLVDYLKQTQQLGAAYFDNKEYVSFGKLSKNEWNNMFAKHLDHHLTQFGV